MIYLLPHIIQESADRYPDQPAVRFNGAELSYAELARRADNLAYVLIEQGAAPHDRVGILLNKSLESAVAVYGIMRAGAAYVPLDPLAPVARLRLVLEDCGIRHLVTHEPKAPVVQKLLNACPQLEWVIGLPPEGAARGCLISWRQVNARTETPPPLSLVETDLAYIMYTSGSTGQPKGMMHTHHSGLSYARMAAHVYGIHRGDRLSNHSPLHFDMSTFDYFSGPLRGATTVIISEAYTKLPASLSKLVEDEALTIWYSVPFALIQMLLYGALETRDWHSLRWVLFGGEPFPPKHLNALMRRLPQARFSNVYGPAEVNQCTYFHVPSPPGIGVGDEPVPIGRVWDNADGLIVDEHDQAVPDGQVGELLVRTPTMMRGYWGRPDLTQRSIFRRLSADHAEEVFYRTGDLVQRLEGGELRFIGRKDRQIKTRGFRVELDDVESVLSRHPLVDENAVYALPSAEGSVAIEAAVLLRADAAATTEELKAHLSMHLPSYAVPRQIRLLTEFPRTTSGKIDRRALVNAVNGPIQG